MISARDLINFDIDNFQREQSRIAQMIADIKDQSPEDKMRIANELIEILTDRNERIVTRSQATFLIGSSSKVFGVSGDAVLSQTLVKTLETEFPAFIDNVKPIEISGMNLAFFQALIFAIHLIDGGAGKVIAQKLRGRVVDSQLRRWLTKILDEQL